MTGPRTGSARTSPTLLACAVLLSTVLLSTVLSACSGSVDGTGDKGYIDGKGVITRLPVDERRTPGPVAGETLEGRQVDLADYRGKVVVLNVWWSQCPPCRAEAADLAAAARALAPRGVVFLGIDTRDAGRSAGLAYQARYDVPYPSIFDPSGRTLLSFHRTLPPTAIPSTVIIDRQGRVAASVLGEVSGRETIGDLVDDVRSAT